MKQSLDDIQMVFLVSRGRSGSTLLQSILDAHPNICAPIESKFILHLKTKYEQNSNWSESTTEQFIKDIYTNRKFRLFWKVSPETLKEKFMQYNIQNFRDACKVAYLSYPSVHQKERVTVIIDKNPAHSRFIPELHYAFPGAKFIHLIREPKASIHSQMQAFNRTSIFYLAGLWLFLNQKITTTLFRLNINSYFLKYEDLVTNPEKEISAITNFLGLDFQETMLSGHKKMQSLVEKNGYLSLPHHRNIGNPINTKSLNKWESKFNKNEQRIINVICNSSEINNFYTFSKEKLSIIESIRYTLTKFRISAVNVCIHILFKLPFNIRKSIYSIVSLVFDKKYTK